MIKALFFDLDGTLVQTEILKAESYARAAVKLLPSLKYEQVFNAFKYFVGLSRKEVSKGIMQRFNLREAAYDTMIEYNLDEPWQALIQIRLKIYNSLISDPKIVNKHVCPYNLGLLKWAQQHDYITGLTTQSRFSQAMHILDTLNLQSDFDFIVTGDDIENPKLAPDIYSLLAHELGVSPSECLVIEDSPSGIMSALDAGMGCIAVTTDFTRLSVYKLGLLDKKWIVDSPMDLPSVAKQFMSEHSNKPQELT